MNIGPIKKANVPSGTYYFPDGTLSGNRPQDAVNGDGLIPVYFRPNGDSNESQGEDPEEDGDDVCNPHLRFSGREKWKKRQLMAKLRRR